jgi:hypothetical protein
MALGLSHAFETRSRKKPLPGRPVYEDESERISIMARSLLTPLKAEYIGAGHEKPCFTELGRHLHRACPVVGKFVVSRAGEAYVCELVVQIANSELNDKA